MSKAGDKEDQVKGFTLLELLTVMALVAILSFSIIYSLQGGSKESFKESQKLIERLLQTVRTTAILKNQESRLMVLHDAGSTEDGRLLTIGVKEKSGQWKGTSTFVTLPEGIRASFDHDRRVSLNQEVGEKESLWNFIEFDALGRCSSTLCLISTENESIKMTFMVTAGGGIEID